MPEPTIIDELDQPALIIRTDRPAITAANRPGRELWGLPDAAALPEWLSPDMPALTALRTYAAVPRPEHPPEQPTDQPRDQNPDLPPERPELVFWTHKGAQRLRCSLDPTTDRAAILVVFDAPEPARRDQPADRSTTAPSATATPPPSAAVDIRVMAHELRTPLGAIAALAEMIEREQLGPVGDPRYRVYARDIRESARLTLSIVSGALEPAQSIEGILQGGFAELDLRDLVGRCKRTVNQAAIAAGIVLDARIATALPHLITNSAGLTQILINLLSNAIKFTPPGGTVTVEVASTAAGGVTITVTDTGVGMTGLDANLLVAPPAPSSSSPPAALPNRGIGFSLVRRLANAMSASLDVTSKRGVGTSVTLTFASAMVVPVSPPST